MSDPAFWRGKRVFLTGHTGFKGAWLSLWLTERGAVVTGYSLAAPTVPSVFELARVEEMVTSQHGDVRDAAALSSAVAAAAPDIVFHLAAQSLVRASYEDPLGTYATNVMGTAHLLNAIRGVPSVRSAVIVTTDKCYDNREWVWGYRESDPVGGHDPYSSSKGCAELVTASFRSSFFAGRPVGIATARAGNVVGGGDWAKERLVPDAIRAFSANEPLLLRHPLATRPWQHVLEPLSGYLLLAERLWERPVEHAEPWNFGPDDQGIATVQSVVETLSAQWGGGATWRALGEETLHEARSLALDCSKARVRLGWRPRLQLERALDWTQSWYRAVAAGADAREQTLSQIREYEDLR